MQVLVFCPNGHVFESRGFGFNPNSKGLVLKGNRENCPACGAWAEVMDGEFDMVDGAVRLLTAPDITLERLRRLRELVGELRASDATREEAAAAMEAVVPNVSRFMPERRADIAGWLAVLVAILAMLQAHYEASQTPSVEQIIEAIIEHQDDPPATPPSTQPPPPQQPPGSPPDAQDPPRSAPPVPPTS